MGIKEIIDYISHDDEVVIVDDSDNCYTLWSGEAQTYNGQVDEDVYCLHYIGGLWSSKIIVYVVKKNLED